MNGFFPNLISTAKVFPLSTFPFNLLFSFLSPSMRGPLAASALPKFHLRRSNFRNYNSYFGSDSRIVFHSVIFLDWIELASHILNCLRIL